MFKSFFDLKVVIVLIAICVLVIAGMLLRTYGFLGLPIGESTLISLSGFVNNEGIGSVPGQANFDGSGFSYPLSQLPHAGQIVLDGRPYLFPTSAPGVNDNVVALGQTINISPANYRQAWLLVATSWGWTQSDAIVHYSDASTTSMLLNVPDWLKGSSGILTTKYRYTPGGIQQESAFIYAVQIAIDKTKKMTSLTLPLTTLPAPSQPSLHVFALTLQS